MTLSLIKYPTTNGGGGGVPEIYEEVTKVELDGLIAGSTLVPGVVYKINTVHPTLYNDGVTAGVSIFLKALSGNQLEKTGTGIFYNPKYNQALVDYGIWNNKSTFVASSIVGTFNANELITANNGATGQIFADITGNVFIALTGNWAGAASITGNVSAATANIGTIAVKSYSAGNKVAYGGYMWTNTSGAIGTATNILTLSGADWTKIPFDAIEYNITFDPIEYDYTNNIITKRSDISGNVVESTLGNNALWDSKSYVGNPINVMQWGNPYLLSTLKGTGNNKVLNGYFDCINLIGCFNDNLVYQGASIQGNNFYRGSIRFNKIFANGEMRNNTSNLGLILDNIINSNMNNNVAVISSINNNIMQGGAIHTQYVNIGSGVNTNFVVASFIYNNVLHMNSTISNNIVKLGSQIFRNTLTNTCTINTNTLNSTTGSLIFANTLRDTSAINSNACTGTTQNTITANELTNSSTITSNALTSRGQIGRNIMRSLSQINSNTVTGGGVAGAEFFIYSNNMAYGTISSNTLTSSGGRKYICQNTLIGDGHLDTIIRRSEIIGVSMTGASGIYFRACNLYLSTIRNYVVTGNVQLVNMQLNNIDYNFNSAAQPLDLRDATVTTSGGEFKISKTFNNAAGSGAIGAITIPLYTVPTGYFVESVTVDVGAGLTAGAGSIINLGFTTDATQGALNDTTGLVTTLNSSGVTKINNSTFTKAVALRTLTAEVKVASISAGTAIFLIKLGKL